MNGATIRRRFGCYYSPELRAQALSLSLNFPDGTLSMQILDKIKMQRKASDERPPELPISWVEISNSISRRYQFQPDGKLSVKMVDDSRPAAQRVMESFLNKFFPSGYPYSVNEGYMRYTQFRALQHFTSAALSVLSTQSLLFAAGLRPTPAQATAVSWILRDGMQHVGKLICSNLGARMDSEPKRWRILADVLYDFGTGLEVMSPLCPHLFLEVAGLGNFAKGMAVVAARATRLPIYSSFAKEGNLSDLFAKGEAISTLFNVLGLGTGIHLASTICSSMQGKLVKVQENHVSQDVQNHLHLEEVTGILGMFVFHALTDRLTEIRGTSVPWVLSFYSLVELTFYKTMLIRPCGLFVQYLVENPRKLLLIWFNMPVCRVEFVVPVDYRVICDSGNIEYLQLVVAPLLSVIHVYSVCEEMRAAPVNTLNPLRTAMIVADFVKTGKISSPADLRYREDLLFPGRLIEDAGKVKVGRSLHEVVRPSKLQQFKEAFPEEKFLLNHGSRWTDMILEHNATGEDALRGWLVAAYASDMERLVNEPSANILQEAYDKMNSTFSPFLAELQAKGWHTDRFLDGTGNRFAF
ncbi:hypothetical protein RDI58_013321 [Solanum bulbocastanum]|uniref:Protein root UVB sensitive 2, chloroplastic n=1 Tax=Solanum bulbocastanum TaxID=147425 RepID=A0AAN8YF44_SOLBU